MSIAAFADCCQVGETGVVRVEHVDEMRRLVPKSQIKVFPGNDHDPSIIGRSAASCPAVSTPRCAARLEPLGDPVRDALAPPS